MCVSLDVCTLSVAICHYRCDLFTFCAVMFAGLLLRAMVGDSLLGPGGLSGVCLGCGAVSLKTTPFLGQLHSEIGQVDM